MKNNKCWSRFLSSIAGAFILGIATSANAALYSRLNGQAVYDGDLNLTWLADANYYPVTEGGLSGAIVWSRAMTWVTGVHVGGYWGWRLPTTLVPDPSCSNYSTLGTSNGFNCTGSEMGHLFYEELGGVAGSSILSVHNENFNLFTNIQDAYYWSGTEISSEAGNAAWAFFMGNGFQGGGGKNDNLLYAWAVHDGDIFAVPIPAAFWLFGSGLIGLLGFLRRHRNRIKN